MEHPTPQESRPKTLAHLQAEIDLNRANELIAFMREKLDILEAEQGDWRRSNQRLVERVTDTERWIEAYRQCMHAVDVMVNNIQAMQPEHFIRWMAAVRAAMRQLDQAIREEEERDAHATGIPLRQQAGQVGYGPMNSGNLPGSVNTPEPEHPFGGRLVSNRERAAYDKREAEARTSAFQSD